MNEKPAIEEGRARLDLNIDDLPPPRQKPQLSKEAKLAAGAAAGFNDDDEQLATIPAVAPTPKRKPKNKTTSTAGTERPWRRTGRTHPVNTNIKPEYNEALMTLVVEMSEREGRPVSKAEVLERAIDSLRTDQKHGHDGGHQ